MLTNNAKYVKLEYVAENNKRKNWSLKTEQNNQYVNEKKHVFFSTKQEGNTS